MIAAEGCALDEGGASAAVVLDPPRVFVHGEAFVRMRSAVQRTASATSEMP